MNVRTHVTTAALLSGALLCSAVVLSSGSTMAAEGAQELYGRGRSAIFEERWSDARAVFSTFMQKFPASPLADDAQYWLGLSFLEMGQPDSAYTTLKAMSTKHPDSPWNDDARALMVRCAESALRGQRAAEGQRAAGRSTAGAPSGEATAGEYEAFLEKSTRDGSSRVRMLAIDTMLESKPGRAGDLLPRLTASDAPRGAADRVLDHFFGADLVRVTMQDPALGLRDGNATVAIRQGETVQNLTLTQALDAVAPGAARYPATIQDEIRRQLERAQRSLVQEGGPGSLQAPGSPAGNVKSAIVKVVDGEVHYYRNGSEVTRIYVLDERAGYTDRNIRIYLDTAGGSRELSLSEARGLTASGGRMGVSDASSRYLRAALAIIEIHLSRPRS
jgi:hypothetical protein